MNCSRKSFVDTLLNALLFVAFIFCALSFLAYAALGAVGGTTPVTMNKVVYVSAGANAIANGAAYTNALKRATAGTTLLIGPGTYDTPVGSMSLLKNLVNQYWYPGATLINGRENGDFDYVFNDDAETVVCRIAGYGKFYSSNFATFGIVLSRTGTKVDFECDVFHVEGTAGDNSSSVVTFGGSGAPELNLRAHSYIRSSQYDAFYFSPSTGCKFNLDTEAIFAFGDLFEFGDDAPAWGNIRVRARYGEQTSLVGQPTWGHLAGRCDVQIDQIKITSLNASLISCSPSTTNGLLHDSVINHPAAGTRGVISDFDEGGGYIHSTGMWLKNVTIHGPTALDPILLTNAVAVPLTLENCTIYPGASATNWIRALNVGGLNNQVRIIGSLGVFPPLPANTNVTLQSSQRRVLASGSTAVASAGLASTNMAVIQVPAHQLTNAGTRIVASFANRYSSTQAGANTNTLIYGATTILNTGAQLSSNCAFTVTATITSIAGSPSLQSVVTALEWGGAGTPYLQTNVVTRSAEANGVNNTLRFVTHQPNHGGVTNETFLVEVIPPAQ